MEFRLGCRPGSTQLLQMQRSIRIRRKKETRPCPRFVPSHWNNPRHEFFAVVRQMCALSSTRSCILSRQNKGERISLTKHAFLKDAHTKNYGGTHIVMVDGKNGVKYAHINRVSTCTCSIDFALPQRTNNPSLKKSATVQNPVQIGYIF